MNIAIIKGERTRQQAIKDDIYRQLKKFDKKKKSYDLKIAKADASNDLHQRLDIRRKIIPKLRSAADYAHRFTTVPMKITIE